MPKKGTRSAEATPHKDSTTARSEVQTMHNIVLDILERKPETRSSDRLLIEAVYDEKYGVVNLPFWQVMERGDLPSFETITRCRRKVQQDNEALRGTKEVEEHRLYKQVEFIDYAGGIA